MSHVFKKLGPFLNGLLNKDKEFSSEAYKYSFATTTNINTVRSATNRMVVCV